MRRILLTAALISALAPAIGSAQSGAVIIPSPKPIPTHGDTLVYDSALGRYVATAPSALSQPLTDSAALMRNATDGTKRLWLNLAGITPGQARTWTIPDTNLTIPSTIAQLGSNTFTGLQTLGAGLAVTGNGAFTGVVTTGDGTVGAPAWAFAADPDTGIRRPGTAAIGLSHNGTNGALFLANGIRLPAAASLTWTSGVDPYNDTLGATLLTDDGNSLRLSNGLSAQQFRVGPVSAYIEIYKSTTEAAVYTVDAIPLSLGSNNSARWNIDTSGNFVPVLHNAYDIGTTGTRLRSIYMGGTVNAAAHGLFGGSVEIGNGGLFYWASRSRIASPANGVITLWNAGQSDFYRLQFGGTTSAHAAIAASGPVLQVATADGAAYAALQALSFSAFGGAIISDQYFAAGSNVASGGVIRLAHGAEVYARDSTNSANRTIFNWGQAATNELIVGDINTNTRVASSLTTPTTLSNGHWWVECSGVSPARVCAINVRDGGVTRTIGSITF